MPGDADQMQRANLGVAAAPHDRCAHPVGDMQGCDRFIDQGDVAIVGHHDIDVDTQPTEFGTQASGRGCKPANRGDRRKFGGGEHDTHERSLADAARDMGDRRWYVRLVRRSSLLSPRAITAVAIASVPR